MNPHSLVSHLEQVLIESMLLCKDRTAAQFGKAKKLAAKVGDVRYVASEALTEVDLLNQETILQHLYPHFPGVAISVEERLDDPTEVQAALYKNDATANYCVLLDPIDGTYCYAEGIRPDYGIIASVARRVNEKEGQFCLGVIAYPSLDEVIIARENSMLHITNGQRRVIGKNTSPPSTRERYSAVFTHDKKRLQLHTEEVVHEQDLYSTAQVVRQFARGEIKGYLTYNGHINDHIAVAWMAQQWGADVEYASGASFGTIPFGDILVEGKRVSPRDTGGLLIVGDREDACFQKYKEFSYP